MGKNVKIENFEGPFDLLLKLVGSKKLDIGNVSITNIIDQYLEEISRMQQVDLDTASDFMLVAATLLKIKTDMLLKLEPDEVDEEIEQMTPSEAKDNLIERLIVYKQFKDASLDLYRKCKNNSKFHPRLAGPDSSFLNLMPNFLENVQIEQLTRLAAMQFARRDEFLLDAAHIAAQPIPVITYVRTIYSRIVNKRKMNFSELIDTSATPQIIVVNFLAILELYKHSYIEISQADDSNDISIEFIMNDKNMSLDDINIEEFSN